MTQFCLIKFKIMSAERNNSTSHLQYDFVRFLRTLQTQIPLKLTGNSKHTANPNPTGLTVSQLSLEKTWFLYREPCSHCRDFPVKPCTFKDCIEYSFEDHFENQFLRKIVKSIFKSDLQSNLLGQS